eukprot:TRINITY_DN93342_c0_g1_i1.p1 TRINITY_DN93342_c0_g1~~TRINITY_DN93342_c0_g1_i1.p1  ORF type:complete len:179 (-),score=10.19 TRINITY_DN93342_c0_g1_i1:118-654(-)
MFVHGLFPSLVVFVVAMLSTDLAFCTISVLTGKRDYDKELPAVDDGVAPMIPLLASLQQALFFPRNRDQGEWMVNSLEEEAILESGDSSYSRDVDASMQINNHDEVNLSILNDPHLTQKSAMDKIRSSLHDEELRQYNSKHLSFRCVHPFVDNKCRSTSAESQRGGKNDFRRKNCLGL